MLMLLYITGGVDWRCLTVAVGKRLCETEQSVKDNRAQRNVNQTRGYFTD